MNARGLLVVGGLLLLGPSPLCSQGVLTGVVLEEASRRPLSGVQVLIEGTERQTATDSAGRFTIKGLPRGRGSALFRAIGVRPARLLYALARGETFETEILLTRTALELEPLVVNTRPPSARWFGAEGFAERRRMGFGRFIDSAELRRMELVRPADVLRRAQAGIDLRHMEDQFGTHVWAASTRKLRPDLGPCWMQIVVDGSIVYRPGLTDHAPPDLANDYNVADLQAIEVYRSSAETPLEFGGAGADCGTVALWTRRGWESGPEAAGPAPSTSIAGRHRRIGFLGGVSMAGVWGGGADQFGARQSRTGLSGGMFVSIPITRRLDLEPEVMFAMKGVKGRDSAGTSVLKLSLVEFPVLAKIYLPLRARSFRSYLHGGPVASFRVGCTVQETTGGGSADVPCYQRLLTQALGVGVVLGAGVELGRFALVMRYDLGLTSLQQTSQLGAVRTRTFSVLSGLAVNVGR